METYAEEVSTVGLGRSQDWVHHVISLLDSAMHQLYRNETTAQGTLLNAASLLRQRIDLPAPQEAPGERGRLLAWQARKVCDYIDSHITGPVLVGDLCALIQRSEAHFSRSFKRTFGESPHGFVVRRRLELAAQYMVTTDSALSDIALRCGFTDQAHLCRHFRQATGQTPAAWRRAHAMMRTGHRLLPLSSSPTAHIGVLGTPLGQPDSSPPGVKISPKSGPRYHIDRLFAGESAALDASISVAAWRRRRPSVNASDIRPMGAVPIVFVVGGDVSGRETCFVLAGRAPRVEAVLTALQAKTPVGRSTPDTVGTRLHPVSVGGTPP